MSNDFLYARNPKRISFIEELIKVAKMKEE
jgi:hypothetical protein